MKDYLSGGYKIGFLYQYYIGQQVTYQLALNCVLSFLIGCFLIGLGFMIMSFGFKMITGALFSWS